MWLLPPAPIVTQWSLELISAWVFVCGWAVGYHHICCGVLQQVAGNCIKWTHDPHDKARRCCGGWSVAGDQDKGRNIDLGCLVIDEASLLLLHWHCSAYTQTYRRYTLHCCSTSWLDALQPIWSSEENCIHRHTLRKLYNDATSSDKWAHEIITRVWWLLVEVKWSLCRLLDIMHYSLLTTLGICKMTSDPVVII